MKVLDKESLKKERFMKSAETEKELLTMINHRNIVKMYASFESSTAIYFILEL